MTRTEIFIQGQVPSCSETCIETDHIIQSLHSYEEIKFSVYDDL